MSEFAGSDNAADSSGVSSANQRSSSQGDEGDDNSRDDVVVKIGLVGDAQVR